MDAFTQDHLHSFAVSTMWDDEVMPFIDWMESLDLEDQEHYENVGWPSARDAWRAVRCDYCQGSGKNDDANSCGFCVGGIR
jgi:hypothetical protein